MLKSIAHDIRMFCLGVIVTLMVGGYAYLQTHHVTFTSTASNLAPQQVVAESTGVAVAKLMPEFERASTPVKPAVKK